MKRSARVFAAIALLLVFSHSARADLVAVDIGVADTPAFYDSFSNNDVQVDFSAFSVAPLQDGNSSPAFDLGGTDSTSSFTSPSFNGITATISANSGLDLEVYDFSPTSDPASGVNHPLGDLAEDGVRAVGADLFLRLSGLNGGLYEITTYHHNGLATTPGTAFDIYINTTGTEDPTAVEKDVVATVGSDPLTIASRTIAFQAELGTDVILRFDGGFVVPGGAISPVLNGFEIARVPKPSTFGVLLVGSIAAVGGVVIRRRRRKAQD